MNKRLPPVGIIAEDDSDADSIRMLIRRISRNNLIGIRKFVGRGCGRINRKCNAWANILKLKSCTTLIVVHDLDTNNLRKLHQELSLALSPSPIDKHLICIPIHEIEAWLLSDPDAIKKALSLRKTPNITGSPESINSPKEYLGEIVRRVSNGSKFYLNTKHNEKIFKELSIKKAKNCSSFIPFYNFVYHHFTS